MGGNAKTTAAMKEMMADALLTILKNEPIERITISEITELAHVGRMSYFRNFSSKEDMIAFKLVCLWNRWADERQLHDRKGYSIDNAVDFFEFNWSIHPLLQLIYQRKLQSAVYEAFYQVMMPDPESASIDQYKSRFYSHGLFGLLDEWIKRKFSETPAQMAEIMGKINTAL